MDILRVILATFIGYIIFISATFFMVKLIFPRLEDLEEQKNQRH